ncbi:MAG: ATP-binding protein [Polyangiaceae bacterium]
MVGREQSKLGSQLASLVEDGPIPVVVQRDGEIVYSNRAATDGFGHALGVGQKAFFTVERIHVEDRGTFSAALLRRTRWRGGLRVETSPGVFRAVVVTTFPVQMDGLAVAFVIRDLTLDLDREAHVQISSRTASAASLASGVAHEINNPLATIMTNAGFVFDQLQALAADVGDMPAESPTAARVRSSLDALRDLHASAERIEAIVRDLRAFVPDGAATAPVDPNRALQIAVRHLEAANARKIPIVIDLGEPPLVETNAARLAQAFFNLLVNAVESIDADAEIVLGAWGIADVNEVRVATRYEEGCAVVTISDTGRGIPSHVRPRMFDAFYSTKELGQGVGLGLFVVQAVVASMAGRIEVESHVATSDGGGGAGRRGTTIRLYLPGIGEAAPRSREGLK